MFVSQVVFEELKQTRTHTPKSDQHTDRITLYRVQILRKISITSSFEKHVTKIICRFTLIFSSDLSILA